MIALNTKGATSANSAAARIEARKTTIVDLYGRAKTQTRRNVPCRSCTPFTESTSPGIIECGPIRMGSRYGPNRRTIGPDVDQEAAGAERTNPSPPDADESGRGGRHRSGTGLVFELERFRAAATTHA